MNLLAQLLALTLAQAQPTPGVTAAAPQPTTGLVLSVGVGVGVTSGSAHGAARVGADALDVVSKALPFTIAIGYRFDPRWSADLNLTYAPIVLGTCADGADASASDIRLGTALLWHRLSRRIVRPWLSLGLGYERFRYVGGCPDVNLTGFDLDFQVGGDIRLSPSWTVGPFASARVGTYVHMAASPHWRGSSPSDEAISTGDLALHEWFSMGLRGTFGAVP